MSFCYLVGDLGTLELVVTSWSTSLSAQNTTSQTRTSQHVLTKRLVQPNLVLRVQCRSLDEEKKINDYIRQHQNYALFGDNKEIQVVWPTQMMNYTGIITKCEEKHVSGVSAPMLTINILLVENLIATKTTSVSEADAFGKFESSKDDLDWWRPVFVENHKQTNDGSWRDLRRENYNNADNNPK